MLPSPLFNDQGFLVGDVIPYIVPDGSGVGGFNLGSASNPFNTIFVRNIAGVGLDLTVPSGSTLPFNDYQGHKLWEVQEDGDLAGDGTYGGNILFQRLGKGLQFKSGSNARIGSATLSGGTIVIANTSVTANTRAIIQRKTVGGTTGNLSYTVSAATSLTVNSTSGTDTSVVEYLLYEAIP